MAMVERSAQDAMRTHYCKFGNCGDVVARGSEFCSRHQTPESRHERPAAGEGRVPEPEPVELVDYKCQFVTCKNRVASRVGRYSYCAVHRSRAVREALVSHNGPVGGTVAAMPVEAKQQTRGSGVALDVDTHEGRLRKVLAAARALDKAEAKMKAASEQLRRAKKAHRDALIEASAPHGVTHAE